MTIKIITYYAVYPAITKQNTPPLTVGMLLRRCYFFGIAFTGTGVRVAINAHLMKSEGSHLLFDSEVSAVASATH